MKHQHNIATLPTLLYTLHSTRTAHAGRPPPTLVIAHPVPGKYKTNIKQTKKTCAILLSRTLQNTRRSHTRGNTYLPCSSIKPSNRPWRAARERQTPPSFSLLLARVLCAGQ